MSFRPLIPLVFFLPILLVSSCQPIYRPNVMNQPLFSGQGDIQASGHVGTNGVDLQASGAVTDHLLAMVNYNRFSQSPDNDSLSSGFEREHQLIEIASGYYTQLGEEGENNNFGVFEAIGGYGNGTAIHFSDVWTSQMERTEGKYHKLFVQPSIGYSHSIFDVGIAPRMVMIDYYDMEVQGSGASLQPDWDRGTDLFVEPAITGRFGYKFIKFQFQFGLSIPMIEEPSYQYQPILFSVGIHMDLDRAYL